MGYMKKTEVDKDILVSKKDSWKEMLATVPVRNQSLRVEKLSDSEIHLMVKRKKPKLLVPPISWIIRPKLERK